MKIDVIGLGYVGLVASACLAEEGHNVTGYDTNTEKLKSISSGDIPFYEPNLNELVKLAIQKQTFELKKIDKYENLFADAIIIAVGTPLSNMGTLDISDPSSYKMDNIKLPKPTIYYYKKHSTSRHRRKVNISIP